LISVLRRHLDSSDAVASRL